MFAKGFDIASVCGSQDSNLAVWLRFHNLKHDACLLAVIRYITMYLGGWRTPGDAL